MRSALNKTERTRSPSESATSTAGLAPVHLEAARWILPLPNRRGRGVNGNDKILMIRMWACAPFDLRGNASHSQVFIRRRTLAEQTGVDLETVKDQLKRLARLGWIRRIDRGWDLAWMTPFDTAARGSGPPAQDEAFDSAPGGLDPRPTVEPGGLEPPSGGLDPRPSDHTKITPVFNDHTNYDPAPEVKAPIQPKPDDRESPRTERGHERMQQGLFGEPSSEPTPKRDPAMEVFDYLSERIIATKRDMKLPARGLTVLAKKDRALIQAMIDANGYQRDHRGKPIGNFDVELGIAACKQVIEVCEADTRRSKDFTWWNAATPFRPANFDRAIGRWRPDGQHVAFGVVRSRASNDVGFNAHMPAAEHEELLRQVSRGGSYGEGETAPDPPAAPVEDDDPWDPRKLGFA